MAPDGRRLRGELQRAVAVRLGRAPGGTEQRALGHGLPHPGPGLVRGRRHEKHRPRLDWHRHRRRGNMVHAPFGLGHPLRQPSDVLLRAGSVSAPHGDPNIPGHNPRMARRPADARRLCRLDSRGRVGCDARRRRSRRAGADRGSARRRRGPDGPGREGARICSASRFHQRRGAGGVPALDGCRNWQAVPWNGPALPGRRENVGGGVHVSNHVDPHRLLLRVYVQRLRDEGFALDYVYTHLRYGRVDRVVFIGGDSELVPRGPRGGSVGVRRTLSRYRCGHVRDADFVNRVRRHPCNHW
mmetsp:Transcript_29024/g.89765  ORF Transcript_29024/g.89765 Transcript_29024/m.89765 type:complete len:299 (-) Transcript_29024:519-1415(-)